MVASSLLFVGTRVFSFVYSAISVEPVTFVSHLESDGM